MQKLIGALGRDPQPRPQPAQPVVATQSPMQGGRQFQPFAGSTQDTPQIQQPVSTGGTPAPVFNPNTFVQAQVQPQQQYGQMQQGAPQAPQYNPTQQQIYSPYGRR